MKRPFNPILAIFIDQLCILLVVLVGLLFRQRIATTDLISWDAMFTLFGTAFPFMLAGFLAWAGLIMKQFYELVPTGLIVWASTAVVGPMLRAMNGGGIDMMLVLIGALSFGLALLGWRLIAAVIPSRVDA